MVCGGVCGVGWCGVVVCVVCGVCDGACEYSQ